MKYSLAILGFVVFASPAHAAGCHTDPFNFVWGSDTSTRMTVASGGRCSVGLRVQSMTSATIARPPSHGTLSQQSPVRWIYQARPGYAGSDAFALSLTGSGIHSHGRYTFSGTTVLSVDVNVGG